MLSKLGAHNLMSKKHWWHTNESVYFVHPFIPRPTTMGRLLRTMLLQRAPILLQTTIAPVWLTEEGLVAEISKCEQYGQRRDILVREMRAIMERLIRDQSQTASPIGGEVADCSFVFITA
jgi:hypothetical protein